MRHWLYLWRPLSAALCPQMPSSLQSAINCYAQTMSCPRHFRPDTVIIIHAIQCALSGPAVSFDCLCGQLFSMAEKLHWLTKSCWGWRAIKTEEFVCYLEKPLKWQMLEVEHGISCMLFTKGKTHVNDKYSLSITWRCFFTTDVLPYFMKSKYRSMQEIVWESEGTKLTEDSNAMLLQYLLTVSNTLRRSSIKRIACERPV